MPASCFAQQAEGAGKLTAVKVAGSKRYPEATIIAASGLTVGQQVRREDLQAAADRLGALGPFENVRYKFSSADDNVTLELQLADAPTVPVYFDNFPWFADEELTQALRDAVVLFDGTAPQTGTILETMTHALEKLMATRNVKGAVEQELIPRLGADGMMLQFRLVGSSLKIGELRFEHELAANDKRVAAVAQDVLLGKAFSRFAVELFVFEQVRPLYAEKGHLRAKFGLPQVRLTGDPNKPLPESVLVVVPIEPGPVYRFAGVAWSSNAAFGPAALDALLTLKKDEPANGQAVMAGWEKVLAEYGRLGYIETKLDAEPRFDDTAARVTYLAKITEGPQYKMGDLVITGLSLVAERKVKEAWKIARGATFDKLYFDEFLARGIKQAFGDYLVNYTEPVGYLLRTNPETKTVDVLLDFH